MKLCVSRGELLFLGFDMVAEAADMFRHLKHARDILCSLAGIRERELFNIIWLQIGDKNYEFH